jgi:hypothetical protein
MGRGGDDDIDVKVQIRNARAAQRDLERLATRGVKRVGTEADRTGRKARVAGRRLDAMGKAGLFAGRGMRRAVGGAVALGAAYLGVGAAKTAVSTTLEFTKSVVGLQKATGLETDAAAKWVGLAKVRGVQGKALNMGMVTLAGNMRKAREEGSEQARMFDQLGVSQEAIQRRDLPRTLMEMSDGLASMRSESEQAAVGKGLLGRGFQSVLPLLRSGGKELRSLMKDADELGVGMDDLSRDSMMELVKAQRELQLGALGLRIGFTKWVAPALLDVEKAGVRAMKVLNDPDLTGEQKMERLSKMGGNFAQRVGKEMRDAEVGEQIGEAFADSFPHIAEAMGRGAGIGAKAFVEGWWDSDLGTKLFVLALLGMKLGVFRALGGGAAKMFIARFAPRLAAAMGVSMAAEGMVGKAVLGGSAGGAGGRWGKYGKVAGRAFGIGLAVTAGVALRDLMKDNPKWGQYSGGKGWGEAGRDIADWLPGEDSEAKRARERRESRRMNDYLRNAPGVRRGPRTDWGGRLRAPSPGRGRGSSLTNPRTTRRAGGGGPEIVVPVSVQVRDKEIGKATGRAKLREEATSGVRWGGG